MIYIALFIRSRKKQTQVAFPNEAAPLPAALARMGISYHVSETNHLRDKREFATFLAKHNVTAFEGQL